MPDDVAGEALSLPMPPAHDGLVPNAAWPLLDRLESTAIGQRAADGAMTVRRNDPAGCFLYGPYLHLAEGCYRLSFHCRSGAPAMTAQPVLGVEIIVLGRFQQEWRDYTAA